MLDQNGKQTVGKWYWWALVACLLVGAGLRLWQLGEVPAGLYRDEAYNGLDALDVLNGHYALFFPRNNGREPGYIYLAAISVAVLGRTILALRLPAALAGIATTGVVYGLTTTWFGKSTGRIAAWLWAITLWPVHLGRIGLRVPLLPLLLALTFWLATIAYRRRQNGLWLAAGLVYGLAFYTYLAIRFTPLLLVGGGLFWLLSGRRLPRPGLFYFGLGLIVAISPLIGLIWQQPDLLLGRTGQVSILNPAINQGHLGATLWQNSGRALGMFLFTGDAILRHNPAGRPVFDIFMAGPFILGLGWAVWHWRKPAPFMLLLWSSVMLGPTILAEDTPHFLRAAGVLPAILIFPAIGLSKLGEWPKLRYGLGQPFVLFLALASFNMTVRDYFVIYAKQPDTGYLFEVAASDLAKQLNQLPAGTTPYLDQRFWDSWPSIPFLVRQPVIHYSPQTGLNCPAGCPQPFTIFTWPYDTLDFVPQTISPPAIVDVNLGSLGRGDLETEAYPIFVSYEVAPAGPSPRLANFANQLQLGGLEITLLSPNNLQVALQWSANGPINQNLTAFVHVIDPAGIIGQHDSPLAQGYWPANWWQAGLIVSDDHPLTLTTPYTAGQQLIIGLYDPADPLHPLPVLDENGQTAGDFWLVPAGYLPKTNK